MLTLITDLNGKLDSSQEIKNRYMCKNLISCRGVLFKLFLFNFIKIKINIHNKFNDLNCMVYSMKTKDNQYKYSK